MNKAYNKITWQNKPSTATPLNQTNLNEMSNALDTIDDRVIALDNGKVSSVTVTNTLPTGDTIATITVDGTATNIKSAQVVVDDTPSATSENPLQNKAIYEMLNNLLPEETVQGNPIAISDASGLNAKACSVDLLPIQDLSQGEPSPTNICPISGRTQASITTNGETVTVQFGQTVYGGTLDVKNGKLTIDTGYITFDGTESWTITGAGSAVRTISDMKSVAGSSKSGICSKLETDFGVNGCAQFGSTQGSNQFFIINARDFYGLDTVAKIQAFTDGMQIAYPLATPIEIDLTAEQISLLKGNNVISTDGDNIKLVYSADIGLYIAGQLQNS